ncbi:hypothetical protein EKN56_13150 [Limnobaculum zhutongyuii]|uniref:Restriction endonuclease type II EcoRII N-terminal domain-containing protein n=1 Tax=Limnobaculum zhutongyuii TaxID=2498113 RepID=A0A411WM88_9GAMM|nr:EcoRII N-terminal effector-binding domain-containing protein [Limnobaculum zhutongyuii]QBH97260.1 hypothetical protein EKN56_13150 [Limnobaculum zhutongyuii]TQS88519.1 hypothetical protein ELQ32_10940 [Limnobaculum zhutongyuii]
MTKKYVVKILSANDTGETGGHQAGILIPKDKELLSFFPVLNEKLYNPRAHLHFLDESGTFWEFAFIYYNNIFFGGTRNEYRLTRMTKYIRQARLVAGDELVLLKEDGRYKVSYKRKDTRVHTGKVLQLGTNWRVIQI